MGACCLSTMRFGPCRGASRSICSTGFWVISVDSADWLPPESSPPSSVLPLSSSASGIVGPYSGFSGARASTLLTGRSCFLLRISLSNSSNQELWPPSAGTYSRSGAGRAFITPSVGVTTVPLSPSSSSHSPTTSPACFFLYHCSWLLNIRKILLDNGVSPARSGCHVLNRRRMTVLYSSASRSLISRSCFLKSAIFFSSSSVTPPAPFSSSMTSLTSPSTSISVLSWAAAGASASKGIL
mmetsp:Transcript_116360/g.334119  ORF Transcript_116360/g.334119 Transcript_116360/m.334119 type:complete len:240 (+) Transcript_116360:1184-1903(+)